MRQIRCLASSRCHLFSQIQTAISVYMVHSCTRLKAHVRTSTIRICEGAAHTKRYSVQCVWCTCKAGAETVACRRLLGNKCTHAIHGSTSQLDAIMITGFITSLRQEERKDARLITLILSGALVRVRMPSMAASHRLEVCSSQ